MDDLAFLQDDLLLSSNLPFGDSSAGAGKKNSACVIGSSNDDIDFSEFLNTPASPISIDFPAVDADASSAAYPSPLGTTATVSHEETPDSTGTGFFFDTNSPLYGVNDMLENLTSDSMQDASMSPSTQTMDSYFGGQAAANPDPSIWLQDARMASPSRGVSQEDSSMVHPSMFFSSEYLSEILAPIQMAVAAAAVAAASGHSFADAVPDNSSAMDEGISLAQVKPEIDDSLMMTKIEPLSSPPPPPPKSGAGRPRKGTLTKKAAELALASAADTQRRQVAESITPPKKRSRTKKEEEEIDEHYDDFGDDQEFLVPLPHKALDPDLARQYAMLKDPSLSSKERRQLRNKLSARSFRERRKDYIEALEGEVRRLRKDLGDSKQKLEESEAEKTKLNDMVVSLSDRIRRLEITAVASAPANTASVVSDNNVPQAPSGSQQANRHLPPSPEQETPFANFAMDTDASLTTPRSVFGNLVRSSRFSPASAANQASMRAPFSPLSVHTVMLPDNTTFPHPNSQQSSRPVTTPANPEILSKVSKLLAFLEKRSAVAQAESSPASSTEEEDEIPQPITSPSAHPSQPSSLLLQSSVKSTKHDLDVEGGSRQVDLCDDDDDDAATRAATKAISTRGGRRQRQLLKPGMDPLSSAAVVRKTPPCTSVDTPLTTTVAASSPPTKPSEPRPFIASPVLAFSKPTIQDNSSRKAWGLLEVAKKAMKHGDLGWLITAVIDELFPAPLCARQRVSSDNFDLPSSPRGRTMSADFDPSSVFDPRTLPVISSPMTSPTTLPGTLRPVQGKIINAMDVDSLVVNCLKGRGISLENVDLGLIKMVLICLMTSAGSSATSASTQSHSQGAAFALAVAAAAHGTCGVEGGFMPFHEGRRSRVPTSA